MRMDIRRPLTARDLVMTATEAELADIFFYYGEERQARRIAKMIVEERKTKDIASSMQLAALISRAVPRRFHPPKKHVATKVFQAIRIAVNMELENLSTFLEAASGVLKIGGR
ncbi:unnamed protein product, partial [Cyprideis torosa]